MTKIKMFAGSGSRAREIAEKAQDAANKWLEENADRVVLLNTQTCASVDPGTCHHSVYLTLTYTEVEERQSGVHRN